VRTGRPGREGARRDRIPGSLDVRVVAPVGHRAARAPTRRGAAPRGPERGLGAAVHRVRTEPLSASRRRTALLWRFHRADAPVGCRLGFPLPTAAHPLALTDPQLPNTPGQAPPRGQLLGCSNLEYKRVPRRPGCLLQSRFPGAGGSTVAAWPGESPLALAH
jgi:hypothetical protein